jgi:hypothetical protein
MATPERFDLFTSLRYDPLLLKSQENNKLAFTQPCPFYMLLHHRNRVAEAANFFGFGAIEKTLSDGPSYQQFLITELKAWQEQSKTEDGPLKVGNRNRCKVAEIESTLIGVRSKLSSTARGRSRSICLRSLKSTSRSYIPQLWNCQKDT